jgi:hypothetical protein
MPTYAQLTHDLLKDTATFFRTLAEQNEAVRAEMTDNANIYERMADTIAAEPRGIAPTGYKYCDLAAKLLRDTSEFYRKLAEQNEPVREQMIHNANIYDQIAEAVVKNPTENLD